MEGIACKKCSGQIAPGDLICPACHILIIRRYCPDCGKLIPEHADPCPYCSQIIPGQRLIPSLRRKLLILIPALCLIAVVASIFMIWGNQSRSETNTAAKPSPPEATVASPAQSLAWLAPPAQQAPAPQEETPVKLHESRPAETIIDTPATEVVDPEQIMVENPPSAVVIPVKAEVPTNTIEEMPAKLSSKDWIERGARMKQGRKLSEIGMRLMKQKKYLEASHVFKDAVEAFPPNTEDYTYGRAMFNFGVSLRMAGQPHEAIPVLELSMAFPLIRSSAAREIQAAENQIKRGTSSASTKSTQ